MVKTVFAGALARLVAIITILSCVPVLLPTAQAQTPSPEQLEMFREMSAEEQQQILESVGLGQGERSETSDRRPSRTTGNQSLSRRQQREEAISQLQESEPRFKPNDTLLLSLEIRQFEGQQQTPAQPQPAAAPTPPVSPVPALPVTGKTIERSDIEITRLQDLRTRILRRNPLQLDKWGILALPELGSIPLAGLTAPEARERLAAEPLLADFVVGVTYLPVKPVGLRALKPFGHDLFDLPPDTFSPATDIPVPAEYVLGPGDTFEVQLVGSTKGRYTLVVRRDGRINFPELGPIVVGGMRFDDARALLERRVSEQLIGTQVSLQMGELRSIQVFVVGDAKHPGAYTVSALSTITNVLFVSGGATDVGSLRNVELKRNGQTVARYDLYDLLLRGDTRSDARLMSGDVILIPPIGRVTGISGEVRRPALYELKAERSVADLVRLAGGVTSEADGRLATIERVDAARKRIVVDVDLGAVSSAEVQDGDMVRVPQIRSTVDDSVLVQGHVHRPGAFQFRPGLRVSDVLATLEELKPMADQHYVLIRREVPPTRRLAFHSVDLVQALQRKGSDDDLLLEPRDQIFVFDLETGRDRLMEPLLRELRLQSTRDQPTSQVTVAGRVNAPGSYPLEPGMRVSDLIRAGGSLNEAAYGGRAELTRNTINGGERRSTDLVEIDLAKAIAGDPAADVELEPFDALIVKELPLWGAQEYVEVQGEVRFPGRYPIQRGETLKSVVARAGGVNELAFAQGTVFTRATLKDRERKQLDELTRRMQIDLAQVSLMAAQEGAGNAAQALAVGQQLLANLREAEPVGRLVINLDRSIDAPSGGSQDIVLKDGDQLLVPRVTQEVTVIGEVQSPTSHLYSAGLGREDYVELSGGLTQRADKSRIYVVRADGSVVSAGSSWFGGGGDIQAGDTIVVPLDAERMRALPLWTAVTTIIYNLAVAVAAVNSF
jgi:polysaccharide biosynthesis/export protein